MHGSSFENRRFSKFRRRFGRAGFETGATEQALIKSPFQRRPSPIIRELNCTRRSHQRKYAAGQLNTLESGNPCRGPCRGWVHNKGAYHDAETLRDHWDVFEVKIPWCRKPEGPRLDQKKDPARAVTLARQIDNRPVFYHNHTTASELTLALHE